MIIDYYSHLDNSYQGTNYFSFPNLGLMSSRESTYTKISTKDGITFVTSPCLHSLAKNVKYTFGPKTFAVR